jgi:hypothetical protein
MGINKKQPNFMANFMANFMVIQLRREHYEYKRDISKH